MLLGNGPSHLEWFCKKGAFKNFEEITEKHLCRGLFLIKIQAGALSLYYKKTPVLVILGKFCEIFKNAF